MSLCQSWVPEDEADTLCDCSTDDVEQLIHWQLIASTILYELSGRQFPGVCSDTVRPCWCRGSGTQTLAYVTSGGSRPIVGPLCEAIGPCGGHASVLLPHRPVRRIVDVVVDGVTLDPSAYSLVDRRWLVRARGAAWPCCQDLAAPDGADGTWSVSYEYGVAPPAGAKEMAAIYGCELAKGCRGDKSCRLPRRVQTLTREGVSMTFIDPGDYLDQGRTGLDEVDVWLRALNPAGLDRQAKVLNPDLLMTHRRQ